MLFIMNTLTESLRWIMNSERPPLNEVQPKYWSATGCFEFEPDIPAVLNQGMLTEPLGRHRHFSYNRVS
jgi:hypothetical protein